MTVYKVEKEEKGKEEREISLICWFTLQLSTMGIAGEAEARS